MPVALYTEAQIAGNHVVPGSVPILAVAGLVTLPILGRRDVNGGVVLAGLVVVLGGFIFAQDMVKHVIVDLWKTLPDGA